MAALASLAATSVQRPEARAAPVAVWAADRDAHRVVGLDENLIVVRELLAAWPIDVEARADGGVWVLRMGNATGAFGMRLTSFTSDGAQESENWLDGASDLALIDGIDALVVEKRASGEKDRLWRVRPGGSARILLERTALECVTPCGGSIVVVACGGTLARIDAAWTSSPGSSGSGTVLEEAPFPSACADLAPGPVDGMVFALDGGATTRVVLLGEHFAPRWSADVGFRASALAVLPGEERVWIGDANGARARRFGPGGALERDLVLAQLAPEHAVAWRGGGALFASPGAILRVDGAGNPRPGQGGFQWLSDLARAR